MSAFPSVPRDAQPDPTAYLQQLHSQVEAGLADVVPDGGPDELYEPVRYVLAGGGKRFRPLLVLLSAEMFGASAASALPAALAVEVFHNFTLVHDDIMDHADERRGRPTVHVRWDAATAVLAGDYMMGLSYELLARTASPRLGEMIHCFHGMVARLCEGQALDKAFEARPDVSVEEYLDMIDGKTSALLQASLELGGLVGNAGPSERGTLREIGRHLGRAFQIQDDLLDLVADHADWGKQIGGDLQEAKKTFLLLQALESTGGEDRAWFARIAGGEGLPADQVGEARRRMERAGVLDAARAAVVAHSGQALACLKRLAPSTGRDVLATLVRRMQARGH